MKYAPSVLVAAAFAILLSCAGQAKVMSGAFAVCARADLGQIVDAAKGTTLEAAVAAIVTGNIAALEALLGALAATVGIDAVDCAIAAVEAAYPPAPVTPSAVGSAAVATASEDPKTLGLARAHAFVKQYRAGGK